MNILSFFNNKNNDSIEEKEKLRKETKDKLAQRLKTQCYLNDLEIKEVLDVIDEHYGIIDKFCENYDYSEAYLKGKKDYQDELSKLNENLINSANDKIKELMQAKLERAKKIFGK